MNNKNRNTKIFNSQATSRSTKRFRQRRMRVALWSLASIGLLTLFLMPSIGSALPLTDQDKFDRVWRVAQGVGTYEFETDVLQTTLPSLGLENLGQTPHRSKTTSAGMVNAEEELVLFDVDTPQGLLEFRIQDDVTYGRQNLGPDTPWVRMDGTPNLFVPGNDVKGYAAAATDIVKVENWRESETLDAVTQLNVDGATEMFTFTIDGNKLAEMITAQQEAELIKSGALAPGQELTIPAEADQVNGSGRLWIDENGLPLYQVLDLNFPSQNQQVGRSEVVMSTTFSGWEAGPSAGSVWGSAVRIYDNPSIVFTDPVSVLPNAYALTHQLVEGLLITIGLVTLVSAFALLIYTLIENRQGRKIYNVTAVSMIAAMVITPFVQVGSLYAYSDRYDEVRSSQNNRGADLLNREPTAAEELQADFLPDVSEEFDPTANPLLGD
ncbi:MAG: hypothetical protein AAF902_12550, partial [Chloroflexota bacterium]